MPVSAVKSFDTLQAILGKSDNDVTGSDGSLVDDVIEEMQMMELADASDTGAALAVFRVVHLSPPLQKLIISPVSSLRNDHVVVQAYLVKEADQDLR